MKKILLSQKYKIMKYSKYYFEKYAQLTLEFTKFSGKYELSDKPDLQDTENNIGIEIVNVETKEEGVFRHLWNQYSGKGLTSNEFQQKLKNIEFKQKVIPNMDCMAAEIGSGDARKLIYDIIQCIQVKAQKFNDYRQFNKNGLYLFANHIWEEQIPELKIQILKNNFPFDLYILNLIDKLIVLSPESIDKYDLSEEQSKKIKQTALDYEKYRK